MEKFSSYSGRDPNESYVRELFDKYPPDSRMGRSIRQADATMRSREMEQHEADIRQEEERIAIIQDRIEQMIAEQELRMWYLIEFGVTADQRHEFQRLLQQVAEHGGLSLREAANLIYAQHQRNGEDSSSAGEVSGEAA